ncbi:transcription factor RSL2-like [Zingiber officinale]|uniref:transcription factor RSL2-like n=1 Tax=Zingiber officinale TaxID=94328 RepID=UPI001C4A7B84|nr:transcription factor RSL2-like [Zingiber officinale]
MECSLEDDSAMLAHLMEQDFPDPSFELPLCSSSSSAIADSSSSYCYYYSSEIENIGSYKEFCAPHCGYSGDGFCVNETDAALRVPGPPVCASSIGDLAHLSEDASSSEIGQPISMLQAKRNGRASVDGVSSETLRKNQVSSNVEKSSPSPSKRIRSQTWQDVNERQMGDQEPSTNPQSLYARKRRERINARLKILQNLVPNGTKVDISTMLEEAVQYVKFLQLQIKASRTNTFGLKIKFAKAIELSLFFPRTQLLSSDELWMYAPIAYNGVNVGLDLKVSATQEQK